MVDFFISYTQAVPGRRQHGRDVHGDIKLGR